MRLASRSLWKTSSPLSGHLTQRFSGVSRRSNEQIFGGTTFEIQFMRCLVSVAAGRRRRSLRRGPHALRQFLTSSVAATTVDEVAAPPSSESLIASTMDEPTTTPSAVSAIARALSAFLTPNPTATGNSVRRFRRATPSATSLTSGAAAPVTPVIETK